MAGSDYPQTVNDWGDMFGRVAQKVFEGEMGPKDANSIARQGDEVLRIAGYKLQHGEEKVGNLKINE